MQNSWIDKISHETGFLSDVYAETVTLAEPFVDVAARFADKTGTVVLMSGGDHDCARYHILGVQPWLTLTSLQNTIELKTAQQVHRFQSDPFEVLNSLCNAYRQTDLDLPPPIAFGLLGYLAYDLKDHLEKLPRTSLNDLELPNLLLFAPSLFCIHDRTDHTSRLIVPRFKAMPAKQVEQLIAGFKEQLAASYCQQPDFSGDSWGFGSNFEKADYLDAVDRIKAYITAGHVYQVNLSQRFKMGFQGNGYTLFSALLHHNPAPFFAYINAGDHQIVSTSPERFLCQTGRRVETRPIKGTRPRGKTPSQDDALQRELQESQKDDAELSMIVDLLRNDIGKVCKAGTVKVTAHKRLEAYQNVYHLVSVVEGILAENNTSVDLIKAAFPGGSITGCPKIRSMEIIDELEPHRRHLYTGSIGYIGFNDTMDLSIAIRTATIIDDQILFSVGGGIVQDSQPQSEYDETLHKGRTLMEVLKGNQASQSPAGFVWQNGQIKPISQATVPVADPGFQYGFGFFETLRVQAGIPHNLKAHIVRFNHAWRELFLTQPPDLTWEVIIEQVISKNRLQHGTAAVKIMAAKGDHDKRPSSVNVIVLARPYTPRLEGRPDYGLHLATYPEVRQTPLARHKTMNYLFYHLAGRWARSQGLDEALILNPDGTISETNSANLLIINDKQAVRPASPHVLPGTMEKLVCDVLADWNFEITMRPITAKELLDGYEVLVMNSLMGVMPVLSVDGKKLAAATDLWQRMNDEIFRP